MDFFRINNYCWRENSYFVTSNNYPCNKKVIIPIQHNNSIVLIMTITYVNVPNYVSKGVIRITYNNNTVMIMEISRVYGSLIYIYENIKYNDINDNIYLSFIDGYFL